tara:strand:+ start:5335 stop:7821 length:2487 start_codon:yes stop_codon:yes gene_type:complete
VTAVLWVAFLIVCLAGLSYKRASLLVWSIGAAITLAVFTLYSPFGYVTKSLLWLIFLIAIVPFTIKPFRQRFISGPILSLYRKTMPSMSSTEREALEAGTVSWDGEVFSGKPNWEALLAMPPSQLTEEEQAFIDGPVEELCRMTDDWEITHNQARLPESTWQFIREHGFFALVMPKEFGGKGFSEYAHSQILTKLYSVSVTLGTTVNVPNSLGPAELLVKYGTDKQKAYYLPRLARGEEVPCFALTGPDAGSDAGAMTDTGIVCNGMFEGKETLGIKLNWNKRYITLAPVATVLGLAFKLFDPQHLLGEEDNIGITCALIPTNTPGVVTGRRHFPANAVFQNGPTQGKDVFIPIDWIIGGPEMAGQGWRMLMECLSIGRAISLPAASIGGAKIGLASSGAYSRIRKQFNLSIGRFEGIQEVLARMAGYLYISDAARIMTVGLIDQGAKPSVASAIVKYHATEMCRVVGNDASDIHGGKAICMGPRNYLGRGYQSIPISITVEGANILTRCLIIFGQGAVRCHPHVFAEMQAANLTDKEGAVAAFDKAFFGHVGFTISNIFRSLLLGLTGGFIAGVPGKRVLKRYMQQFTRYSSAFALLADMSMLVMGGDLKRKECISGRLGDILSMLYLGSAVIKRHVDNGEPEADLPVVHWTCQYIIKQIQDQMDGVLANFPNRVVAMLLRGLLLPLGRHAKGPSDRLSKKVARLMIAPTDTRQRIIDIAYMTAEESNPVGQMEETLKQVIDIEPLEKRLNQARKAGEISGNNFVELVNAAVDKKIIETKDASLLRRVEALRQEVIAVDDFDTADLQHGAASQTAHHHSSQSTVVGT